MKAAALPAAAPAPVATDPAVLEVLEAQDAFAALWKQLNRVFKARARLEDGPYLHAVLTATAGYFQLAEPERSQFAESAHAAARAAADARKEREAARKALPPRDRNNPATLAAYQRQKDAVDVRYDDQLKAAVETLKGTLVPGRPRHAEFMVNAEKWLKNLAPRSP